jgi:hypothetical protein
VRPEAVGPETRRRGRPGSVRHDDEVTDHGGVLRA